MTHRILRSFAPLLVLLVASPASAQQWQLAARAGAASGVEAGDPGTGSTLFRRARTRLLLAVDAAIDERPEPAYELQIFAELEPHTSLGGELRLSTSLGTASRGFVGVVGVAAPHTLLGGGFGVRLLMDDPATTCLFVEPSVTVLPLGTDLAGDQVIVWGLLSLGIHGPL